MKSIRLNVEMRQDILTSMLEAWKKSNPAPYNLAEETSKIAETIWKNKYGKIDFSGIPTRMLRYSCSVQIQVNGTVKSYKLQESMPMEYQSYYNEAILKVYDKEPAFIAKYNEKVKENDKWNLSRSSFEDEIKQIIYSVNTTKQLVELWPEAEQYLPAYAADPSKGVNLPALKTSRLNAALGLGDSDD